MRKRHRPGRFPSRQFAINQAWLTCVLSAIDLIAWTQTILIHDQPALAKAEPKTLRYRLLHVPARLVRGGRTLRLKFDRNWRWATKLATAFQRLHALAHDVVLSARSGGRAQFREGRFVAYCVEADDA